MSPAQLSYSQTVLFAITFSAIIFTILIALYAMFAFGSIAVFVTVAFSAVTSAIPFGNEVRAVKNVAAPAAIGVTSNALLPVAVPPGLADILTNAQAQLIPVADSLSRSLSLHGDDVTLLTNVR